MLYLKEKHARGENVTAAQENAHDYLASFYTRQGIVNPCLIGKIH